MDQLICDNGTIIQLYIDKVWGNRVVPVFKKIFTLQAVIKKALQFNVVITVINNT